MRTYCVIENYGEWFTPKCIEELKDKELAVSKCKELRRHKDEINAKRKLEGKRPVEGWGVYIGDTFECMIGERIF